MLILNDLTLEEIYNTRAYQIMILNSFDFSDKQINFIMEPNLPSAQTLNKEADIEEPEKKS